MKLKKEIYNARLQMFATYVLRLLEENKEWTFETIEDISYSAIDLNLAKLEEDSGNFVKISFKEENE